jgi:ankyrin repeat protein
MSKKGTKKGGATVGDRVDLAGNLVGEAVRLRRAGASESDILAAQSAALDELLDGARQQNKELPQGREASSIAKPNPAPQPVNPMTPLMQAAKDKNIDEVKRLLATGVDPDKVNPQDENKTAAMYAAEAQGLEVIKELYIAGANLAAQDNTGKSVAKYANRRLRSDIQGSIANILLPGGKEATLNKALEQALTEDDDSRRDYLLGKIALVPDLLARVFVEASRSEKTPAAAGFLVSKIEFATAQDVQEAFNRELNYGCNHVVIAHLLSKCSTLPTVDPTQESRVGDPRKVQQIVEGFKLAHSKGVDLTAILAKPTAATLLNNPKIIVITKALEAQKEAAAALIAAQREREQVAAPVSLGSSAREFAEARKIFAADMALIRSAKNGDIMGVVEAGKVNTDALKTALIRAAENGHFAIFTKLLTIVGPELSDEEKQEALNQSQEKISGKVKETLDATSVATGRAADEAIAAAAAKAQQQNLGLAAFVNEHSILSNSQTTQKTNVYKCIADGAEIYQVFAQKKIADLKRYSISDNAKFLGAINASVTSPNPKTVKFLLDIGPPEHVPLALDAAAKAGSNIAVFEAILDHAKDRADKLELCTTALKEAVESKNGVDIAVVTRLIDEGADVFALISDEIKAPEVAQYIEAQKMEMIRWLYKEPQEAAQQLASAPKLLASAKAASEKRYAGIGGSVRKFFDHVMRSDNMPDFIRKAYFGCSVAAMDSAKKNIVSVGRHPQVEVTKQDAIAAQAPDARLQHLAKQQGLILTNAGGRQQEEIAADRRGGGGGRQTKQSGQKM